jgi:hypothetical protein
MLRGRYKDSPKSTTILVSGKIIRTMRENRLLWQDENRVKSVQKDFFVGLSKRF